MKPAIAPRPADPIDIDPGVPFNWVIAANHATSVGYIPNANFEIDQTGKTLAIICTGAVGATAQIFSLSVFASNSEGTVYQKLNFRIPGHKLRISALWSVSVQDASSDIKFGAPATTDPGLIIGDQLNVDGKVLFGPDLSGNNGVNLSNQLFFVKSLAARTFKVSLASGGAAVAQDAAHNGNYQILVAFAVLGSDMIYVRDSSKFAVDDPIILQLTDGTALPPELQGVLYVKEIVDSVYIKVAATVGGAAIVASDDVVSNFGAFLAVVDGTRSHPSITSAEETDVDLLEAIDYTPTTDIPADEFEYQGLPAGLEVVDEETGEVTGNPSESGFFAILVLAYKGDGVSYRYWILVVGGDSGQALKPDLVYDVLTKRFYGFGPAGRADRIEIVLGDPPLLIGLEQWGENFSMPEGATVRIRAKQKIEDVADLVLAEITLSAPQSLVQLAEDWAVGGLSALLAGATKYADLWFWFEWRLPTDVADKYRRSYPTPLRLWRSDDAGLVSTAPAFFVQTKPFSALTGGTAVALDGVVTAGLAVDTWTAKVVRTVGGQKVGSEWFLVTWDNATAAADEATSADRGIVIPTDFNAVTNKKMWVLISGL